MNKNNQNPFCTTTYGIDVSHHNKNIDWEKVIACQWQQRKLNAVFMKATEGKTFVSPKLKHNWDVFNQLNKSIDYKGVYHFYRTELPGKEQAKHFVETIESLHGFDKEKNYYVIDLESNEKNVEGTKILKELSDFYDLMTNHSFKKPIIYTNTFFWNQNIGNITKIGHKNINVWNIFYLWLARYGKDDGNIPQGDKWYNELPIGASIDNILLWQFTSKGIINGIETDCDLSIVKQ